MKNQESTDSQRDQASHPRLVRLLEGRHKIRLEWFEPWPALTPQDTKIDAHVTHSATVHDCINMERVIWHDRGCEHIGRDIDLLQDFIVTHWADVIEPNAGSNSADLSA